MIYDTGYILSPPNILLILGDTGTHSALFITFVKNIQTCAGEQGAATHGSLEETRATVAAINTVMFAVWSITAHFAGHRRGQSSSCREKRYPSSDKNFRSTEILFRKLRTTVYDLLSLYIKTLYIRLVHLYAIEIQDVIFVCDWIWRKRYLPIFFLYFHCNRFENAGIANLAWFRRNVRAAR